LQTVGKSDDKDGTVRIGATARNEARRRLEDVQSDATISDGAVGVAKSVPVESTGFGAPTPEMDLPAGHPVGEYQIEEVLGRGGFGTVYRAVQPLIGKRVAIKVLSRKFSSDSEMVSRFVAEARAVNQIRHRHIIDIFSFGQLPDGRQYYVMEHLEGEPLDRHLANKGALTLEEALPILRAVARALDAAHAKGVAHRDLKAENVFLARDDEGGVFPKLLDFGIAKLSNSEEALAHKTHTGVPIGTPYYMSPEQARGSATVDYRTDIYSFGVLAYRLLTGTYPFDGSLVDILHKQIYFEADPPSFRNKALTEKIDDAINWMMRKSADERPKNAVAAVLALGGETPSLRGIVTPLPTSRGGAVPAATTDRLGPVPSVRRRWVAPVIGLVFVAVGAAAVLIVMNQREPSAEPKPTESRASNEAPALDAPAVVQQGSAAVDAAAVAPVSSDIIVKVVGVPDGTEVFNGAKRIGAAPGDVQVPRGTGKVVLTFRADGYHPLPKTIVPSDDQTLEVKLKKKAGGVARPVKNPEDDPDGVIPVFGKEKNQ
jgi:serine/threonine-protein kinase